MISVLRFLLRKTKYYHLAANFYHQVRRLWMRSQMFFVNAKYLHPRDASGPYKSQFGQDYYLEKLGLIERDGFFVEIGCNHPVHNSNSYYLEKNLHWSGVSIDGVDFSKEFKEERDNTTFVHSLVDVNNGHAEFFEVESVDGWETQISSMYESNLKLGKGFTAEKKLVQTQRLSDIPEINRSIDLCLIDVEGHEFKVLDSVDWNSNPPAVFVIENVGEFYPRSRLINYMGKKGYDFVARIGATDDIFTRV